jgi:lipoprotein-releasing system permease protein
VVTLRLLFFVALRQLWARKGLNGIAVAGVALGVLVLVAMRAIMTGFQHEFIDNVLRAADHVVIRDQRLQRGSTILAAASPTPLLVSIRNDRGLELARGISRPVETMRTLEALPEVLAACGRLSGQTVVAYRENSAAVNVQGIEPHSQQRCTSIAPFMKSGSFDDFATSRDGILLGSLVAERLGAQLGDRVRVVAPDGIAHSFKVHGTFEVFVNWIDRGWAFTSMSAAQAVFGSNRVSEIGIRTVDPQLARALTERVERITGYDAENWQEVNAATLSVYRLQNTVVAFQIAAILLVGGFGILAVQIMLVLRKARDIAILRAVGFQRSDILIVFLIQSIVIATLGALLGDVTGWQLVSYIDRLYDPVARRAGNAQLRVLDEATNYMMGTLFAIVVGTLAGVVPAWRGSRVEPVDVLRGQIG